MRVGMIVYGLEGAVTGIGRYTVEIVKALHSLSDHVELVLLTAGQPTPLLSLNLPMAPLTGAKLLPALMTIGSMQLPRLAHTHRLDIIHDPLGVVPLGFGVGRAKSVTTIHDVVPLAFPGVSTRLDSLIYKRWLPFITPRLNAIITVSEASKRDIMHHYKRPSEQVHAIPNAVDGLFKPAAPAEIAQVREKYGLPEQYILFVGSVEERKNLRRVLQAYGSIQHKVPHHLVIVGPKKWKYAQILDTLDALGLHDKVTFTGYADQQDLPVIYSGAALFVYPSLYEGFGLPPLEAMACGVPVLTSDTSSLPEVVGKAGVTVDPYNVEALAEAMHTLLTDPELRGTLSERGLMRARQFTWERTAQGILDVYQRLLALPTHTA